MKKLFFIIITFCLSFQTTAEDLPRPAFHFPKEIPADKGDVLAERILGIAEILRSVNYESLQRYWADPSFDDGIFIVDYYGWNRSDTVPEGTSSHKYNFTVGLYLLDKNMVKEEGFFGNTNGLMVKFRDNEPFVTYYEAGRSLKCHVRAGTRRDSTEFAYLRLLYHAGYTNAEKLERKKRPDKTFSDKETDALYQWDKEGRLTFKGDADILLKKWQIPEAKTVTTVVPKIDWGTIPQIPNTKDDKNLQTFFERMKQIMSARKFDEFALLLDLPIEYLTTNDQPVKKSNTHSNFLINNWKCQWGTVTGYINQDDKNNFREIGFAFVKDAKGMPAIYLEGEIDVPNGLYMPKLSEHGRGIEVRFHDTGYPKSYRSLVRGRLYGRQIEWNDRGRVTSDVDLDIPKEIKEKKWFPSIF